MGWANNYCNYKKDINLNYFKRGKVLMYFLTYTPT